MSDGETQCSACPLATNLAVAALGAALLLALPARAEDATGGDGGGTLGDETATAEATPPPADGETRGDEVPEGGGDASEEGGAVADEAPSEEASLPAPSGQAVERLEPWHRRTPRHAWFELSLGAGPFWRHFEMPIDPAIDMLGRSSVSLATADAGEALLAGKIAFFPFAATRSVWLRGLAIEGGGGLVVGMDLQTESSGGRLATGYSEIDVSALYRMFFGSLDVGADVAVRVGYHRTKFDVSDIGNDLVPPFAYDAVRFGLGLRVPLGTRHLSAVAAGSYLLVVDVGPDAEIAYNESGSTPAAHGADVSGGLVAWIGGVEIGVRWTGRWLISSHEGTGRGFGFDPTTRIDGGSRGIRSTDDAVDRYMAVLATVGYRYGARPGSQRLQTTTDRDESGASDRRW